MEEKFEKILSELTEFKNICYEVKNVKKIVLETKKIAGTSKPTPTPVRRKMPGTIQ